MRPGRIIKISPFFSELAMRISSGGAHKSDLTLTCISSLVSSKSERVRLNILLEKGSDGFAFKARERVFQFSEAQDCCSTNPTAIFRRDFRAYNLTGHQQMKRSFLDHFTFADLPLLLWFDVVYLSHIS